MNTRRRHFSRCLTKLAAAAFVLFCIPILTDAQALPTIWEVATASSSPAQFCHYLPTLAVSTEKKFADAQVMLSGVYSRIRSAIAAGRAQRDEKTRQARSQAGIVTKEKFAKLESLATTDTEKQAVIAFETATRSAVDGNRRAVDAAVVAFRNGLDQVVDARISSVNAAIAAYKLSVEGALTSAQNACSGGGNATAIAQTFLQSASAARTAFFNSISAGTISSQVKALIQTEAQALQQAAQTFKTAADGAAQALKLAFSQRPVATTSPSNVPAQYQKLYTFLSSTLASYDKQLAAPAHGTPITFGGELLIANANRGTALLAPQAMQGVKLELDRFQQLGMQGVTIALSYPLYTPNFPNYAGYVSFYKQVAQEVRKHNMKLDIEAGPIFPGPPLNVNYSGLTMQKYLPEKKQMVQTIINDLHPDYINIGSEPDNDATIVGLPELNSIQAYTNYINAVLDGLNRGTTKIGAGIGTWGNVDFVKSFAANTGIDFVDLHFYPIKDQYLQNAIAAAAIAHQYHKGIVMDEVWLSKMGPDDAIKDIAANYAIFSRDVYSFWRPLDQQFIQEMAKFAAQEGVEYLSPFWTNYFFAYLDYNQSNANSSYDHLTSQVNTVAAQNIISGTFSPMGIFYKNLISSWQ